MGKRTKERKTEQKISKYNSQKKHIQYYVWNKRKNNAIKKRRKTDRRKCSEQNKYEKTLTLEMVVEQRA